MKGSDYSYASILHVWISKLFFFKKRSEYSNFVGLLLHLSRNPGAHTALQPPASISVSNQMSWEVQNFKPWAYTGNHADHYTKAIETHYCFCIAVRIELNNWYHNSEHETLVSTTSKGSQGPIGPTTTLFAGLELVAGVVWEKNTVGWKLVLERGERKILLGWRLLELPKRVKKNTRSWWHWENWILGMDALST